MRRLTLLCALLLASSALLPASEFDWMVREFTRQSGVRPLHIPFFGLARFIVAVSHPSGTSEFKLAVFEHPALYPETFARLADATVGSSWKTIVRVRSRNGEFTNIYSQPDGKHLRLLIATLDKDDAVFVQLRIQSEKLSDFMGDWKKHHHA